MQDSALTRTRHSLHAVAEHILAAQQYDACARIALAAAPGGFSTCFEPALAVVGTRLTGPFDPIDLDGITVREACSRAGLGLIDLGSVYADGASYGPDEVLALDAAAAELLAASWAAGDVALRLVAPDATPILWPEHFDVGVTVDEVNLGVSPGDAYLAVPYAYVGPWTVPPADGFFNAPFGAARPVSDFAGPDAIAAFFAEGLARATP